MIILTTLQEIKLNFYEIVNDTKMVIITYIVIDWRENFTMIWKN